MDRSYRLKMEEQINNNILTTEYVFSCIAKYENRINQLAYKEKQYRSMGNEDLKLELKELIAYRKPFIDFLMIDCHMNLIEIKNGISNVKAKNIPTKKVCEQIRNIIISGVYQIK